MKITRILWLVVFVAGSPLTPSAFGQSTPGPNVVSEQHFKFADRPDLQETMKGLFDSMNVWIETPRSATTFREAYACALSFKVALLAQASTEKNAAFRSQMKELAVKTTLILGHLEEFLGSDAASKKLADASLEVAVDAAKRDEFVKSAVASVFASAMFSATDAKVKATSGAFSSLCQTWEAAGGPLDFPSILAKSEAEATLQRLKHMNAILDDADEYLRTHPKKQH